MFNFEIIERYPELENVLEEKPYITLFAKAIVERLDKEYEASSDSKPVDLWAVLEKYIPSLKEDFEKSDYTKKSDYLFFMVVEMYERFYQENNELKTKPSREISEGERLFVQQADAEDKRASALLSELSKCTLWSEVSVNAYLDFVLYEKKSSAIKRRIEALGDDQGFHHLTDNRNFRNWIKGGKNGVQGGLGATQFYDTLSALNLKFNCFSSSSEPVSRRLSRSQERELRWQRLEGSINNISSLLYEISDYSRATRLYVRRLPDLARLFLILNGRPHNEYNELCKALMHSLVNSDPLKNEFSKILIGVKNELSKILERFKHNLSRFADSIPSLYVDADKLSLPSDLEKKSKEGPFARCHERLSYIFNEINNKLPEKNEFYELIKTRVILDAGAELEILDISELANEAIRELLDEFIEPIKECLDDLFEQIKELGAEKHLTQDLKEYYLASLLSEIVIKDFLPHNTDDISKLRDKASMKRRHILEKLSKLSADLKAELPQGKLLGSSLIATALYCEQIDDFYSEAQACLCNLHKRLSDISDEEFFEKARAHIVDQRTGLIPANQDITYGEHLVIKELFDKEAMALLPRARTLYNVINSARAGKKVDDSYITKLFYEIIRKKASPSSPTKKGSFSDNSSDLTPTVTKRLEDSALTSVSSLCKFVSDNPTYFSSTRQKTTLIALTRELTDIKKEALKAKDTKGLLKNLLDVFSCFKELLLSDQASEQELPKFVKEHLCSLFNSVAELEEKGIESIASALSDAGNRDTNDLFSLARLLYLISDCAYSDEPEASELNSNLLCLGLVPLCTSEQAIRKAPLDWYIRRATELSMEVKIRESAIEEIAERLKHIEVEI